MDWIRSILGVAFGFGVFVVGSMVPRSAAEQSTGGSAVGFAAGAIGYGVVKMNVDTDTQYAFTRPVAGHMFTNYDGVLKVDGDVGSKKAYDPRTWGKAAEESMAHRVVQACEDLLAAGKRI